MCESIVDVQFPTAEIRQGKKKERRKKEKLAGVPQNKLPDRSQPLVRPKFTILCEHLEEILLLNRFFRLSIRALHVDAKI